MGKPEPTWVSDCGRATLYCGDCLDVLPGLDDDSIDLGLTDPPFGVSNFVQVSGRLRGRGSNRGKAVEWNEQPPPPEFFDHLRRITRHRIIWGANFFNSFEDRGGAIVWVKGQKMPNFSKADIASCTHYQKTELVEIPWTNFAAKHRAETDHPCERPVELYLWCLSYLPDCKTVIDPYMGSGSTGKAAAKAGIRYFGIERDPKYFGDAKRRIKKELESNLFLNA